MTRIIIFGLAIYALYVLFLKDKIIIIAPKDTNRKKKDGYSDYEEIK
jgi:hypothetical protein